MSKNKASRTKIEGVQFYRRNYFRDAFRTVLVTLVIFCTISFLAAWFIIDSGARRAYKEARDIRKALRAVGTEYYGGLESIYNPQRSDGMAEGAAEKIAELSHRNGEVTLYEWDYKTNGPISFEYKSGLYRVVYNDTGLKNGIQSGTEGDFKVYYSFELLSYEAE